MAGMPIQAAKNACAVVSVYTDTFETRIVRISEVSVHPQLFL